MKEKFITTNQLANDASKVLKNLKKGEGVVVLRYSKPVGAVISYEDYKKIENMESDFVHECKACLISVKKGKKNA
jgi:prevent-host-death family protein